MGCESVPRMCIFPWTVKKEIKYVDGDRGPGVWRLIYKYNNDLGDCVTRYGMG